MDSIVALQSRWTSLYKHTLPSLAKARDPVQPHWPVHLDHCFARIVLDNAVGKTSPWTEVVKAPAVKNMTVEQLISAIELGEKFATGEADLVELDGRSLTMRGKKPKGTKRTISKALEEDRNPSQTTSQPSTHTGDGTISKYLLPSPKRAKAIHLPTRDMPTDPSLTDADTQAQLTEAEVEARLKREKSPRIAKFSSEEDPLTLISSSKTLTTFRKEVFSLLCGVPAGHYTTYVAISNHISATSHKTCARAVGNAMRNNPFAPIVPCHRVLAANGSIGGFGGSWGEGGEHAKEKRELLQKEGLRFDAKGKAVGRPWHAWDTLEK